MHQNPGRLGPRGQQAEVNTPFAAMPELLAQRLPAAAEVQPASHSVPGHASQPTDCSDLQPACNTRTQLIPWE